MMLLLKLTEEEMIEEHKEEMTEEDGDMIVNSKEQSQELAKRVTEGRQSCKSPGACWKKPIELQKKRVDCRSTKETKVVKKCANRGSLSRRVKLCPRGRKEISVVDAEKEERRERC